MRKLSDIKNERESKKQRSKERCDYKHANVSVPYKLWNSVDMLEYFKKIRAKHGFKMNDFFEKRAKYTQLSAINRLRITGDIFIMFVSWVEERNQQFPKDIWYLVNQFNDFKKFRPDLFRSYGDASN